MRTKIKNWFICWFSFWYYDIHTPEDSIKGIKDNFGEYTCKRCKTIYK